MPTITSGRLALATSSLALVVAVGGVGYAAATIGTKDIVNNAVTSKKIKNDNVKGADVKESTLAKVPSAAKADSATNAATSGGVKTTKVHFRTAGAPATSIFVGQGLTITAACASADVTLTATSSTENAHIGAYSVEDSNYADPVGDDKEGDFDTGETFDLLAGGDGNTSMVTFNYDTQSGGVVTGQLSIDENGTVPCAVTGFIFSG